ncbi:MAG: hypothetical protein AB1403_17255, partial [Candidatus Riflebacteria bacterium]
MERFLKSTRLSCMKLFFRNQALFIFLFLLLLVLFAGTESRAIASANDHKTEDLFIKRFSLFLKPLFEEIPAFQISIKGHFDVSEKNKEQKKPEQLLIFRNRQEWGICLESSWRNVAVIRTATATKIVLPDAGKVFIGFNSQSSNDLLAPEGFARRFITPDTSLYGIFALMNSQSVETALKMFLAPKLKPLKSEEKNFFEFGLGNSFKLSLTQSGPVHLQLSTTEKHKEILAIKSFEIDYIASPPETLSEKFSEKNLDSITVSADDMNKMV